MPSFGITAQGASRNAIGPDALQLCGTFSPASNGTLVSFTAWLDCTPGSDQACKFALYTNTAGPYPDALVTGSDTVAQLVLANTAQAQYTVACTGAPAVSAGTSYWLAILTDASGFSLEVAYDAGADLKYGARTYTLGFPATVPAGFSDVAFQYSIAANFTETVLRNVNVVDSAVAQAASR